jgi:hypothetical protein
MVKMDRGGLRSYLHIADAHRPGHYNLADGVNANHVQILLVDKLFDVSAHTMQFRI